MERAVLILPADDLGVAKEFHVEGLGFAVTFDASADAVHGLLGLAKGGIALTIDAPMSGHGGEACVSIEVSDAEDVSDVDTYDREWSAHVRTLRPLRDEPWGARTFDLVDPLGDTISVIVPARP